MLSSCAFCGCASLLQKDSMRALFWKIPRNYRRCGECSGFTLIPKLTSEELDELYSDYYLEDGANLVAAADDNSNNWIRKYKETIRFLRTQELDSKTFLDFGCGIGKDVELLKAKGIDIVGYDPFYFPEFPTEKFDTILCFYVLNVLLPEEQAEV